MNSLKDRPKTATVKPAVHFSTRAFRNVLYVRAGKLNVCGVRSARERSFEEASGDREVADTRYRRRWRRSHAHCRRWRWRCGHAPPVRKPNPNLNQRTSRA